MRLAALTFCCLAIFCLASCSVPQPALDISLASLAKDSCASDTVKYEAAPLDLSMSSVTLGPEVDVATMLPPSVKFLGGWHLASTNTEFGGLSGLERLPSGTLLAVSDKGYFLTFEPRTQEATIMPLLDANGKSLTGKTKGDAEGLAVKDGLVFVSFERQHRILAYNLARCGVAAQGVLFAGSPEKILQTKLNANDGAESLDVTPEGHIRAGYEMVIDGASPLVTFGDNGALTTEIDYVPTKDDFKLVGADEGFMLFRAYDAERGNRNIIRGPGIEFELAPPLNVDNFEGLTVEKTNSGQTRLYLVSDDNFSARQRTLLYIFEISH